MSKMIIQSQLDLFQATESISKQKRTAKMAKLALVLVGLVFLYWKEASAGCFCGLTSPGKDVCHNHPDCAPLVVRPQTLPKIPFTTHPKPEPIVIRSKVLQGLRPLGDLCSCRKTIVTPALVPRPACMACGGGALGSQRLVNGQFGSQYRSSEMGGSQYGGSQSVASQSGYTSTSSGSSQYDASQNHGNTQTHYDSGDSTAAHYVVPADAVSVSLAYNMQNQGTAAVHEDKLNFGFRTLPKEIKIEPKKINNIPEENLFSLNGEIVELKKVQNVQGKSVDEEAAESLIDEELEEGDVSDDQPMKKLTYGEIGFAPANIKSGKFTQVVGHGSVSHTKTVDQEESMNSGTCNDGFINGKLIVQNVPNKDAGIATGSGYSSLDLDLDIAPVRYPAFGWSSSSSSSSSAASSASHSQSSSSCGGSQIVYA